MILWYSSFILTTLRNIPHQKGFLFYSVADLWLVSDMLSITMVARYNYVGASGGAVIDTTANNIILCSKYT